MKFLLAGNGLEIAGTIADWHPQQQSMREDQWHSSTFAGYLCLAADHITNGGNAGAAGPLHWRLKGEPDRAQRWRLVRDLRIIANSIVNNGARADECGGLRWRLESEPVAAPAEEGEAA